MRYCIVGGCAMFLCGWLAAGAAADPQTEIAKDRNVIPKQKHEKLAGKVIGLLVADAQPVLSVEGRSGPPDSMCFARGLHSYRWVYVPTPDQPLITNLAVRVGDDGNKTQTYPALNMANPKSVTPWGVTQPYSLVEAEVNSGLGSPPDMSFVGTSFKVLDGSKEYPLKVTEVVTQLKKRYADWHADKTQAIDKAMAEAQTSALKDQKPTGPREKTALLYLTWLPQSERVRAQFLTKMSDGAYSEVQGGPNVPPLPPGKLNKEAVKGKGLAQLPPADARIAKRPFPVKLKVGTTFGIEFGMAYEVDKSGKLVRIEELPIQSFTQVLQPPPGIRPGPIGTPPPPDKQ